jgi:hypothetical protein
MTSSFPNYSLTTFGLKKPGQVSLRTAARLLQLAQSALSPSLSELEPELEHL